jgi:hypothetical protein
MEFVVLRVGWMLVVGFVERVGRQLQNMPQLKARLLAHSAAA